MRRTTSSWLSTIAKLGFRRERRRPRKIDRSFMRRRPQIESLEERAMLATYTVDSPADTIASDGLTTLREALVSAYSNAGPDTIDFAPSLTANGPATITLAYDGADSGSAPDQLLIDSDVTIDGPGASLLSISGNDQTRVFVVSSGVEATINGLTITGGKVTGSADGGGIFNFGDLTLDSVHITDNETERRGGGIYSYNGTVRIVDSTISDNWADTGGGITSRSYQADALVVENSAVINNHATYAAGAFITYDTGAGPRTSKIINSTFSGNTATSNGGAITANLGVTVTIVNSTITENTSGGVGGGIRNSGSSITLHNMIVAGNTGSSAYYADWADTSAQSLSSYNLIGINGSSNLTNNVNGNQVGNSTTPLVPGLTALGDYGGPTKTHALLVGSPAIDAGDSSQAVDGDGNPLAYDQRGHQRPIDLSDVSNSGNGSVDIGAFEAGNPTPIVVDVLNDELDDIDSPTFDWDDVSLREALAIAATRAGSDEIDVTGLAGEIYLEMGQLVVDSSDAGSVSIAGPGADQLTINAHGSSGVVTVNSDVDATISGLTITGGFAFSGGGIRNNGKLTLQSVKIHDNEAEALGGAIYSSGDRLIIENSTIRNNIALDGGAIYNSTHNGLPTEFEIVGSTITGNTAYGEGGGLYCIGSYGALIQNTTISDNRANEAAGIYLFFGDASIVNSTIAENEATNIGGGIRTNLASVSLTNSTVAFNRAATGGGIYADSIPNFSNTLEARNTIVAENTQLDWYTQDDIAGTLQFTSGSDHNLLGSGGSAGLSTDPALGNIVLLPGASAGLMPVFDDNFLRRGYALLPESPAIDAGNDDAAIVHDLVFDQWGTGFDRILGEHIDMGATEGHVIQRGTELEVYGTGLNDNIFVNDNLIRFLNIGSYSSLFSRLGQYTLDVASASEVHIFGYAGDDKIEIAEYFSIPTQISGGDDNDNLIGGAGRDIIHGNEGRDIITGRDGDDDLFGDDGDDILFGSSGDDLLSGGDDDDHLFGGHGTDTLNGGAGNNTENSGDIEVNFKPERLMPDGGGSTDISLGFAPLPPFIWENQPEPVELPSIPYLEGTDSPITPPNRLTHYMSNFVVGWTVLPDEFKENGSLVADKIAIVQIAKSAGQTDQPGVFEVWEEREKEWHIDTPSGQFVYPTSASGFYGAGAATEVDLTLVPASGGVISALDRPGAPPHSFNPGPYTVLSNRQEFETYVICLEGAEEMQFDYTQTWAGFIRTFKSITVYGGVKWFHDFQVNADGSLSEDRGITDQTGAVSENFEEVLHKLYEYDGTNYDVWFQG